MKKTLIVIALNLFAIDGWSQPTKIFSSTGEGYFCYESYEDAVDSAMRTAEQSAARVCAPNLISCKISPIRSHPVSRKRSQSISSERSHLISRLRSHFG